MSGHHVTRRSVLKYTGGAVGVSGLAANVGASETIEVNVGYENERGRDAAVEAAAAVKREFAFDALTIQATRKAAEGLSARPDTRYVELNGELRAHRPGNGQGPPGSGGDGDGQTTPYGIEKVEAPAAHDAGETGDGAAVTIIDTGIDPSHETLEANVAGGKAWVDCRGGGCEADWADDEGHGTHVAGTAGAVDNDVGVLGVGTEVDLYAAKVLDNSGSGSYSDVAAAIEWSADQGHDVANMSLGGGQSDVVSEACEYAYERGVLLVASAGNDGPCTDCVNYPAAEPTVLAVSATDEEDELASFSSTGPEVELAAPGVGVLSSLPDDDYDEYSGTSMSAPHVSGGGALLMANEEDNETVRQELKDGADDVGLGDDGQGAGRLNVADALGL